MFILTGQIRHIISYSKIKQKQEGERERKRKMSSWPWRAYLRERLRTVDLLVLTSLDQLLLILKK